MRVELVCSIFCASAYFPSLNARGGMSAIIFSFPAIIIGVTDDDFHSFCQSASN